MGATKRTKPESERKVRAAAKAAGCTIESGDHHLLVKHPRAGIVAAIPITGSNDNGRSLKNVLASIRRVGRTYPLEAAS